MAIRMGLTLNRDKTRITKRMEGFACLVRVRRPLTWRHTGGGCGGKQYPTRALDARGLIDIGSRVSRYARVPGHARVCRLSDRRMRENCTYGGMGRGW